ncbi:MAG TPA: autotransporter outer membrane beta-barrel domain-containing protein [Rhizomicrobium sp.]|nr:autotransporter outer membrane beta-barrel domain-containing protein [Rhizomicrobium sp.]
MNSKRTLAWPPHVRDGGAERNEKHPKLQAAAMAMLAATLASPAHADTTISSSTTSAVTTSSDGSITIDSGGSVAIQEASTAAVTINSNNAVLNNGSISNTGVSSAVGVQIDTSSGNITPTSTGLSSTGTIDVSGNGTGKYGIEVMGGNTFYGPITLTSLTSTALSGTSSTTSVSDIVVKGDSSAAFELVSGTKITSNVYLGGSGIVQNASTNSTASNSVIVDFSGTLNGTLTLASSISGVGAGMVGVEALGGIHACASDLNAPAGFSCPSFSGGSLINSGSIALVGTSTASSKGSNPESGSAIIIGASVDGGFLNNGAGTGSTTTDATISASGVITSSVTSPTILIDPSRTSSSTPAALILGPVTADIDGIDPGYSFINRGSISASPTDAQLSAAAIIIQGESATYYTCLSAVATNCSTTASTVTQTFTNSAGTTSSITYDKTGGILNTGTISAQATTSSQLASSGVITATALYIGAYATVPRIDVMSETESGSTRTAGTINAAVSGVGPGTAYAISIGADANVPQIDVGVGATISATVSTTTTSPGKDIATTSAPFSLVSEAILDQSNTLKLINNAGTIKAANTTITPQAGATTTTVQRAIDLSASSIGNITINNSGEILGDVLFGGSGSGDTLNVGNITASGNPVTGVTNTANDYAVIAGSIISQSSGSAPSTYAGYIDFGSGTNQTLHVGSFGYVNAVLNTETAGALAIQVDANGQLIIANTTSSVQASTVVIAPNGTLALAMSEQNLNSTTPVVQATNSATLSGASIGLEFGTYIASSSPTAPVEQTVTLIRAPVIKDTTLATQNLVLGQNTPFLFESPASAGIVSGDAGPTPLSITTDSSGEETLLLHLLPRSVNATNADGSPGLNLSGEAKQQFPFITAALATDPELGSAIAASLTVYNNPGVASSGINVTASQQQAQQKFSQFAPDVSGGTREIAILLTDQATGPVAARQRLLRSYADQTGDTTLWGQEFTGHINNRGRMAADGTTVSYKDHGFGFSLGMDGGSARNGWYGGAFTFYSGDVAQLLPRATKTQTEWYMLTGYTEWKGKHVFLDTHLSAAYGNFTEDRSIQVGSVSRDATSRRPGLMGAVGANTGVMLKWSGIEFDPHISMDAMTLREEGYQEANGGSGFNLDVAPYFASSLRGAVGTDIKGTLEMFGVNLTPEARLGYRYDFLQQAVKINAAFASTGGRSTAGNTMTFIGPDPDSGNAIAGLSLGAGTDVWQLGINYDWVRGNNASTTQVGTITVLGRF